MLEAFGVLIGMDDYGGRYVSLTPDHPNFIDSAEYVDLVARHIMFKDMSGDKYLQAAGIASDWPYGRGCYISQDRECPLLALLFSQRIFGDHLRVDRSGGDRGVFDLGW